MKRRLITTLIIGVLILSFSIGVFAQSPGKNFSDKSLTKRGPGFRMPDKMGLLFDIGLSDKQIAKISGLRNKRQVDSIPIKREMKELHEEMLSLRDDLLSNKSRLITIAERLGELKTMLKVSRLEGRSEMLEVLSPEQRESLKAKRVELMENRKAGRFNRRMKDRMPNRKGPNMGYNPLIENEYDDFDFPIEDY